MKILVEGSFIPTSISQVLGWTLIHSLWIGLVIALLAGAVITFTRQSKATWRYRLLVGLLMLFVVAISGTFYSYWQPVTPDQLPVLSKGIPARDVAGSNLTAITTPQATMLDGLTDGINSNINGIVLVWLLVFLLKSGRMAGGLFYIHRLKTYRTHPIPQELIQKMALFAHQLGIPQSVRLIQSEQVKVPVTVGWLEPLILLPMGSFLQLPPDQLESILWHELAHIKRYDYGVNLVQGLLETVFFFNPGLLWLSSLIRAEREACCDDLVVGNMKGKASYLEALLAFNTPDYQSFDLALGLGSGNPLRDRMNRLVTNENTRLGMAEKVLLSLGFVVLSAFLSLPNSTQPAVLSPKNGMSKKSAQTVAAKPIVVDFGQGKPAIVQQSALTGFDSLPAKIDSLIQLKRISTKQRGTDAIIHDITAETIHGKTYHGVRVGTKLVAMAINGEQVKDSDLPAYEPMLRLFRQQERDQAVVLAKKFKTDKELGQPGYLESVLSNSSEGRLKPSTINRTGLKSQWRIGIPKQNQRTDRLIQSLLQPQKGDAVGQTHERGQQQPSASLPEQTESLRRMQLLVKIAELQSQEEKTNQNQSVTIGQLLQQLQTADRHAWKTNVK